MFEEAEWTGERLLQVESDAPLEKLGMYNETDRKYMLLQLSRVRDCKRVVGRRVRGDDSGSFSALCRSLFAAIMLFCDIAAADMAGVTFETPRPVSNSTEQRTRPVAIEMEPMLNG